jgi:hypothetical protein
MALRLLASLVWAQLRRVPLSLWGALPLIATTGLCQVASGVAAHAAITIYANDFQGTVGSEWSATSTDVPPADETRRFLGRFADGTVSLSLSGLPTHTALLVEFDLFITASWDGGELAGGDVWSFGVSEGPVLLRTTFSNFPGRTQDYPDGADNPPKTGATEIDTLGYEGFLDFPGGDSVYHLSFDGENELSDHGQVHGGGGRRRASTCAAPSGRILSLRRHMLC